MSIPGPSRQVPGDAPGAGSAASYAPSVYSELRRLAEACLRRERSDHTLQPTALVHEAFLKLSEQRTVGWHNRSEFLGVAAQAMRRILVDHARAHDADKRSGAHSRVPLDESLALIFDRAIDLLALDEALSELARIDPRKARVVELRFFAGLTAGEAAETLSVPLRTVERDWTMARAWLRGRIVGTMEGGGAP